MEVDAASAWSAASHTSSAAASASLSSPTTPPTTPPIMAVTTVAPPTPLPVQAAAAPTTATVAPTPVPAPAPAPAPAPGNGNENAIERALLEQMVRAWKPWVPPATIAGARATLALLDGGEDGCDLPPRERQVLACCNADQLAHALLDRHLRAAAAVSRGVGAAAGTKRSRATSSLQEAAALRIHRRLCKGMRVLAARGTAPVKPVSAARGTPRAHLLRLLSQRIKVYEVEAGVVEQARAPKLPHHATLLLQDWLLAGPGWQAPYPSDGGATWLLAAAAGISDVQLRGWLVNARRRMWRPMRTALGLSNGLNGRSVYMRCAEPVLHAWLADRNQLPATEAFAAATATVATAPTAAATARRDSQQLVLLQPQKRQ